MNILHKTLLSCALGGALLAPTLSEASSQSPQERFAQLRTLHGRRFRRKIARDQIFMGIPLRTTGKDRKSRHKTAAQDDRQNLFHIVPNLLYNFYNAIIA